MSRKKKVIPIKPVKKEKAVEDTEQIIGKLVKDEIARAKNIYETKKKQEIETLHNRIVDAIQETGAHPTSVVFVLELIKEEVLRQFLGKVTENGTVEKNNSG